MKVIIAGSRDFFDLEAMKVICDNLLETIPVDEFVSGTAKGADRTGEKYAEHKGIPVVKFPANWDKHGKIAGFIRNNEMADYAHMLIAFWDGKSPGTRHMIKVATEKGLQVEVYYFNQ